MNRIVAMVLLAACCTISFAQQPASQPTKFTAEQIKALIAKLDSEALADREAAQKQLVQAGPAALDALKEATNAKEPEIKERAAEAIEQINTNLAAAATEAITKNYLWSCPIKNCLGAKPIIAGGKAYVTDGSAILYAVDLKTGKVAWKATLPEAEAALCGSGDKAVMATSTDCSITAYDQKNGAMLWQGVVKAEPASQPASQPATKPAYPLNYVLEGIAGDDYVAIRPAHDLLKVLSAQGGKDVLEVCGLRAEAFNCQPLIVGGVIYFNKGVMVEAVELSTQKSLWSTKLQDPCSQMILSGRTLCCVVKGRLVGLDPKKGDKQWETDLISDQITAFSGQVDRRMIITNRYGSSDVVADDAMAYLLNGTELRAWETQKGQKVLAKQLDLALPGEKEAREETFPDTPAGHLAKMQAMVKHRREVAKLTARDGTVLLSTAEGIFAFDGKTGVRRWVLPLKHQVASQPVIVDGVMYFATQATEDAPDKGAQPMDLPGLHAIKLPK